MLDTRRDIPGQHWGDYQFTGHDYDALSADPTVDVRVLSTLPAIVKTANLGGYVGLSADARTAFAQLMGKTTFVSSGSADPITGNAVPSTDGRASTWLTDAVAGGYAVLFDMAQARSGRASLAMTRTPAVAWNLSAGGQWAVAAAPDGMVQAGAGKMMPAAMAMPVASTPSPTLVQMPTLTRQPSTGPVVDAISQPILKSPLITGIVAKTAVEPAASTSQLFPDMVSMQPQRIVSAPPPIQTPTITPPTPMPRGPLPGYPPITPPAESVDISSLVGARRITGGGVQPMPLPEYAPVRPEGSEKQVAPTTTTLTTLESPMMRPDGTIVTTGEEGALPAGSSKTLYYVGGAVVLAGIGYYLLTKKGHTPNRRRRRR